MRVDSGARRALFEVRSSGLARALAWLVVLATASVAQVSVGTPVHPSAPRDVGLGTTPVAADFDCTWKSGTPSPIPRFEAATVVIDGRVFLIGGFETGSLIASSRVDIYNPATDTWTTGTDVPGIPPTHAGYDVDGRHIWIAGGFAGDNPGPTTDAVLKYDTVAGTWTVGPSLPAPRGSNALVRLGRKLHVFGGVGVNKSIDEPEHWILDLDDVSSGWSTAAPLPHPRNHLGGAALGGLVYSIGGQLTHDSAPTDTRWLEAYDPETDTWTQRAELIEPRSHFEPSTFIWKEKIVIAGGRSLITGQSAMANITIYDPVTDAWSEVTPLPKPLNAPSVQLVGNDVVLVGGATGAVAPQDDLFVRSMDSLFDTFTRFNCGGDAYSAATLGTAVSVAPGWCADAWFAGGGTFTGSPSLEILGTPNDTLYRSERNGSSGSPSQFRYEIPVDPGTYRVTLHFAEIYWGVQGPPGVGRRVFDVTLEDSLVLDDYDIFADVGPATAVTHTFDVPVLDGFLDVWLVASKDQPKMSAIDVIKIAAPESAVAARAPGSRRAAQPSFELVVDELPANTVGMFAIVRGPDVDNDQLSFEATQIETRVVGWRAAALGRLARSGAVTLAARVDEHGVARLAIPRMPGVSMTDHIALLLDVEASFVHPRSGVRAARIEAVRH